MKVGVILNNSKEKVKLDEILKYLFSTSNKVLIKLLNGVFNENFNEDEVDLTVSNNEFIEDTLSVIRGDMFFDIRKNESKKASYHLEFQTKNDNTMVIRMFEYGFKKGKEASILDKDSEIETMYFPNQKVIFFEQNKNINDILQLKIIFPNEQEIIYAVEVLKYWELTNEDLIKRKMYPLIPLQLFSLRKELETAQRKNDVNKIKDLSYISKNLAEKLAREAKDLFSENEILGEDFHKMLLAIQNLIEYLNRNYFKDDKLEEEVNTMTKTLYDPEVEKKGFEQGVLATKIENAKNLLDLLDDETISSKLDLDIEIVKKLRFESNN